MTGPAARQRRDTHLGPGFLVPIGSLSTIIVSMLSFYEQPPQPAPRGAHHDRLHHLHLHRRRCHHHRRPAEHRPSVRPHPGLVGRGRRRLPGLPGHDGARLRLAGGALRRPPDAAAVTGGVHPRLRALRRGARPHRPDRRPCPPGPRRRPAHPHLAGPAVPHLRPDRADPAVTAADHPPADRPRRRPAARRSTGDRPLLALGLLRQPADRRTSRPVRDALPRRPPRPPVRPAGPPGSAAQRLRHGRPDVRGLRRPRPRLAAAAGPRIAGGGPAAARPGRPDDAPHGRADPAAATLPRPAVPRHQPGQPGRLRTDDGGDVPRPNLHPGRPRRQRDRQRQQHLHRGLRRPAHDAGGRRRLRQGRPPPDHRHRSAGCGRRDGAVLHHRHPHRTLDLPGLHVPARPRDGSGLHAHHRGLVHLDRAK